MIIFPQDIKSYMVKVKQNVSFADIRLLKLLI